MQYELLNFGSTPNSTISTEEDLQSFHVYEDKIKDLLKEITLQKIIPNPANLQKKPSFKALTPFTNYATLLNRKCKQN
jgi:hypothetical protein